MVDSHTSVVKLGAIGIFWGLISSLLNVLNYGFTPQTLIERILFLPLYLTTLIGNPFVPTLHGEGVIAISGTAIVYVIFVSVLFGFVVAELIGLLYDKFKK